MSLLRQEAFMQALTLTKAGDTSTPSLSFTTKHPIPSPPPGHLLVKIYASAIQPSDIFNAQGGFSSTTFPRIPGRDFSGVVVGSGDDDAASPLLNTAVFGTSGFTHGFTTDGFHAEYAVVPVDGVAPKPPHLSHLQAATVGVPFTTAALMVKRSKAMKGDTILVLGAHGAVGSAASIMLDDIGCHVLRAVRGAGGDLDTSADPGLLSVRNLTDGRGVDVVIDTVGLPVMTSAAIDCALGHGGRLVFIAAPKGPDPTLTIKMRDFYRAEKTLLGLNSVDHSSALMAEVLRGLERFFESGRWMQGEAGKWTEISIEKAAEVYLQPAKGHKYVINLEK